jgi:hypothetical protein
MRYDSRRPINKFITPGPLVGTTEGFVLEDLSTGGMLLRRAAPGHRDAFDKKGLDLRFAWLTVPLPNSEAKVTALIEVVHREQHGTTELIRARFEEMPITDRIRLCDYLAERDSREAREVG